MLRVKFNHVHQFVIASVLIISPLCSVRLARCDNYRDSEIAELQRRLDELNATVRQIQERQNSDLVPTSDGPPPPTTGLISTSNQQGGTDSQGNPASASPSPADFRGSRSRHACRRLVEPSELLRSAAAHRAARHPHGRLSSGRLERGLLHSFRQPVVRAAHHRPAPGGLPRLSPGTSIRTPAPTRSSSAAPVWASRPRCSITTSSASCPTSPALRARKRSPTATRTSTTGTPCRWSWASSSSPSAMKS